MAGPDVLILHRAAASSEPPLVSMLAEIRGELVERQAALFRRAGSGTVRVETEWRPGLSFGELLARLAPRRGGLIVLGGGAVPRLNVVDARRLVAVAASGERRALTNNRYSSDVCAIGRAGILRELPPLPSDNALPRWLEEVRGFAVGELPGRDRLALDLDTPLDVALAALAHGAPQWLRRRAAEAGLRVPRLAELRALAADPLRELLVFGRTGSRTLVWLERNVRCRVRFLAEERGLRAASPLAMAASAAASGFSPAHGRGPAATLGRLLDTRGAEGLAEIVAGLSDGAILDSRVLLAHRLGADETAWPPASDRFASDLLREGDVHDPWLRALTGAAAHSVPPILLGGHTLVGPGIQLMLAGVRA